MLLFLTQSIQHKLSKYVETLIVAAKNVRIIQKLINKTLLCSLCQYVISHTLRDNIVIKCAHVHLIYCQNLSLQQTLSLKKQWLYVGVY
jgi:hypothetical protein